MYSELILRNCMKKCRMCNKLKVETQFFKNGFKRKNGTSGSRNECKQCSKKVHDKYAQENRTELNAYMRERYTDAEKVKIRNYGLKKAYGLTPEKYQEMFDEQEGKCAICKTHQRYFKRTLDVDHDHDSGKIRGLLCIRCNRGIGLLQDSTEVIEGALDYLRKNKN